MTRSRRILKIAKWAMAALSLLSVAVWVFAVLITPSATWEHFWSGAARFTYWPEGGPQINLRGMSPMIFPSIVPTTRPGLTIIFIRYLFVTATLAICTATLFLIDRRRIPPGHCRCGYDLTGNITGVCPECGTLVASGAAR